MNPVSLIAKKRDGQRLESGEIQSLVSRYTRGEVSDAQMAALAMAIYLRGMDSHETAALTEAMLRSGETLRWSDAAIPKVDKHSTGGIGDKTSLILAPLLACCGLHVPMISGRGLGPTGGTLDKLESIPGFRTDLNSAEIRELTERVGCVITGATENLAPADRKLYAVRDVTATVASIPLITASIMSKKLAEGLDALVLDVKFGSGAFMKTLDDARDLADSLVAVGTRMGVKTSALLTDMSQPLGRMIGNAVEVNEAVDVLSGGGPADLRELVLALGAEVLWLSGSVTQPSDAIEQLSGHIASERALNKFREMVAAQGGDLDAPRLVKPATDVRAPRSGYVQSINAEELGWVIIELGGGRKDLHDRIDHSVGLECLVRVGDHVERGQPIVRVFADNAAAASVQPRLEAAFTIGDAPVAAPRLILRSLKNDAFRHRACPGGLTASAQLE